MFKSVVMVVFSVLVLSGCASVRLVDTDVRSFVTPPGVTAGATYRFERLPSQQASAAQARLETLAQVALGKVGLMRKDTEAGYSVQVTYSLRVDPYAPWEQPFGGHELEPGLWNAQWSLWAGIRSPPDAGLWLGRVPVLLARSQLGHTSPGQRASGL